MMDPSVMNAGLQALFPAKVKKFEICLLYTSQAVNCVKKALRRPAPLIFPACVFRPASEQRGGGKQSRRKVSAVYALSLIHI